MSPQSEILKQSARRLEYASFGQQRQRVEVLVDRLVVTDDTVEIRSVIPPTETAHIRFLQVANGLFRRSCVQTMGVAFRQLQKMMVRAANTLGSGPDSAPLAPAATSRALPSVGEHAWRRASCIGITLRPRRRCVALRACNSQVVPDLTCSQPRCLQWHSEVTIAVACGKHTDSNHSAASRAVMLTETAAAITCSWPARSGTGILPDIGRSHTTTPCELASGLCTRQTCLPRR